MKTADLKPGKVLRGPIFSERVQITVASPIGDGVQVVGHCLQSAKMVDVILTPAQLVQLETSPDVEPFVGEAGVSNERTPFA